MAIDKYFRVAFVLALLGVLFSGYLSAVKLFTSTCAFNESCPYFLGYPACWYGFAMFLTMFITVLVARLRPSAGRTALNVITAISALGILFAGRFAWIEIAKLAAGARSGYALGMPTCVYGLVFYIAIFVLSLFATRGVSRSSS